MLPVPITDSECLQHVALWLGEDSLEEQLVQQWMYVKGKGICDRQLLQTLFPIKTFYQNFVYVFNPRTLDVSYCLRKVVESFRTKANILEKKITNIIKYFLLTSSPSKVQPMASVYWLQTNSDGWDVSKWKPFENCDTHRSTGPYSACITSL